MGERYFRAVEVLKCVLWVMLIAVGWCIGHALVNSLLDQLWTP